MLKWYIPGFCNNLVLYRLTDNLEIRSECKQNLHMTTVNCEESAMEFMARLQYKIVQDETSTCKECGNVHVIADMGDLCDVCERYLVGDI